MMNNRSFSFFIPLYNGFLINPWPHQPLYHMPPFICFLELPSQITTNLVA